MADYTNSSKDDRSAFPENAVDAQEWSRLEPLLSPRQLERRFLWGVPLQSSVKNPITNKYDRLEEEDLKDIIMRGVAELEMDSKIDIFPVKRSEKKPFDRNELMDGGYMRSNYRPILSIDKLSIAPGNSADILTISKEWMAKDGWVRGEIRIVPTIGSINSGGYIPAPGGAGQGSAFVAIMGGMPWVPSFWTLEYTTGFADGMVPRALNELIGCYAAIEALSLIATTNKNNSQSVSGDGFGQSQSNGGPSVYDPRIKLLTEKRDKLLKKFKAQFGAGFVMSNI